MRGFHADGLRLVCICDVLHAARSKRGLCFGLLSRRRSNSLLSGCRAFGGDLTRCRQLVITDGGGPNSMQRALAQKAAAQMNGALMPVAVVSASTFVRMARMRPSLVAAISPRIT